MPGSQAAGARSELCHPRIVDDMPLCICTCLHKMLGAEQGSQDPVTVVPSELVLRTQSDIISTFGRGGAAAKSPAAPHPPPLPESELPYSSSSEDVAESDASSLAHETDHAARHSPGDARHHMPSAIGLCFEGLRSWL